MPSDRAHGIYVPPDKAPKPVTEQIQPKEVRRSRVRTAVISSLATILVATGVCGIMKHEQEMDRSTKEISALVKELGYIGAEAYMRTKDGEAYITLHAPGCAVGDPEITIDNVSVQLQDGPAGLEIAYFSHKSREEKVDGEWRDVVDTWREQAQLCDLLAG